MVHILFDWGKEMNWFIFFLPPFFIWFLAGGALLGFSPVLKRLTMSGNLVQITQLSLKRASIYKWELLFMSLSLTILTYIYNILLVLGNELFSAFPDNLASTVGFLCLLLVFFAKLGKIAREPPSHSFVKSVKYFYGGFSNPFEDYKTYKVLEEVKNGEFSDEL